jgi:SAM-dependent methyltransferase
LLVQTEFPNDLLPLLRCSQDGGALSASELRNGAAGVIDARLTCQTCAAEFRIRDGIALMMAGRQSEEDKFEMAYRDSQHEAAPFAPFVAPAAGWRSKYNDLLEIPPHLKELEPAGCKVLEFGCGDGRITILVAQSGAKVLAVDFSLGSLRKLAAQLPAGIAPTTYRPGYPLEGRDLRGQVGLVQADASSFHVAPRSFDRALSTTPLDSIYQRMAMYRTIADALTDEGRYIGSVEHDDLTRRILGLPVARRYWSGIFIEHFDVEGYRRETAPFFRKTRIYPMRPRVPFLRQLPAGLALAIANLVMALPVLKNFGEILLLRAEQPIRPPVEGINRPGIRLAKRFFYWYMRRLGKEPLWDSSEKV